MTGQVAASAPIAVASGGTLELLLGTLATSDVSVTDDGVAGHGLIAEPVAGATVTIGTSITGALQLGAFDAGAGGSVVLTSAATVSGNVDLNGPGIFSLSSANVHGHVVFDDAGGAVLQIQGTSFTPTIVWSTEGGEIDLTTATPNAAGVTTLTANSQGALNFPGYGTLQFGGAVADGASYSLIANGSDTLRLILKSRTDAITDGNRFQALTQEFANLPTGAAANVANATIEIGASNIATTSPSGDASLTSLSSGLSLSIQRMFPLSLSLIFGFTPA